MKTLSIIGDGVIITYTVKKPSTVDQLLVVKDMLLKTLQTPYAIYIKDKDGNVLFKKLI